MNKVLQRREICCVNKEFSCFFGECVYFDDEKAVCSVSGEPPQVETLGPTQTGRRIKITKRIDGSTTGPKQIRLKRFPSVADVQNYKSRIAQEKRRAELLGGNV